MRDRRRRLQSGRLADLADARWVSTAFHGIADDLQDLVLTHRQDSPDGGLRLRKIDDDIVRLGHREVGISRLVAGAVVCRRFGLTMLCVVGYHVVPSWCSSAVVFSAAVLTRTPCGPGRV